MYSSSPGIARPAAGRADPPAICSAIQSTARPTLASSARANARSPVSSAWRAERPERLPDAVVLSGPADEQAVGPLPVREVREILGGRPGQAGEIEGVGHDRRVAQPEGVVLEVVDRLDPRARGEPVAAGEDLDEARRVGVAATPGSGSSRRIRRPERRVEARRTAVRAGA